eukprot:TRINITY_DN1216_c0_g1_i1.p1 TRINITY_DN1216_c0_g1~~TRINITY_DN1216_c0_g1_i1.p1  ORF type:complete len:803 (+),score=239.58 TRINITY_DN1216_c0_g1_i1:154-2562(+)
MAGGSTPPQPPSTPPLDGVQQPAAAPSENGTCRSAAAAAAACIRTWLTLVVHDAGTADLARWAADSLLSGVPCLSRCSAGDAAPAAAAAKPELQLLAVPEGGSFAETVSRAAAQPAEGRGVFVVAVFSDGRSSAARGEFARVKEWAAEHAAVVQAINGKRGQHHFWTRTVDISVVEASLVDAVSEKLTAAAAGADPPARHKQQQQQPRWTRTPPAAGAAGAPQPLHADPQSPGSPACLGGAGPGTPATPVAAADSCDRLHYCFQGEEELAAATQQISIAVREGQGETVLKLGCDPTGAAVGISDQQFAESMEQLKAISRRQQCEVTLVVEKQVRGGRCAEVLIRRDNGESYIDMRVAVCGNVDSGKSTLVGVLTRGQWDDGRGAVRSKVFNHRHEQETGRTSSISEQYLGFDARGNTVNYAKCGEVERDRKISNRELSDRSAKVYTLYDLAGHERYLKTTVLGMTGTAPDYAAIVISANNGIQRMTKEHLGLCLALRIPFFIVITRIDATPANVMQATLDSVLKMLKLPSVRKLPYLVKRREDVFICAKNIKADRVAPIFQVSNVAGTNIHELLCFLNLIPVRRDWSQLTQMPREMVIDSTFYVSGVGTVVGGIVTQGTFRTGDSVLLGPNGHGQFRSVQIKSIQVKGVDATHVDAGSDAAFALKKERRSAIRKGNVLLDTKTTPPPHASWEFEADVVVLYHSTTIKSNYEPVIHCTTVRQSAKITLVDTDVLRTGDKARVRFRFLYRPEYIRIGAKLVFREGRTKGLGTVTAVCDDSSALGPKTARGRTVKDRQELAGEAS